MNQTDIENKLSTLEQQEAKIIQALQQLSGGFNDLNIKLKEIDDRLADLEGREVPQTNFDDSITGSLRVLQQEVNQLKANLP